MISPSLLPLRHRRPFYQEQRCTASTTPAEGRCLWSAYDVPEGPAPSIAAAAADGEFVPLHAIVEEAERRHIRSALERTGGSVMKTSELLGISHKTLLEKMKKLRIGAVHDIRQA